MTRILRLSWAPEKFARLCCVGLALGGFFFFLSGRKEQ